MDTATEINTNSPIIILNPTSIKSNITLKIGTDGQIITYDASGDPVAIATGTAGHFLKSQGGIFLQG